MTDKPLTEQNIEQYLDSPQLYGAPAIEALARDWLRLQQRLAEAEKQKQHNYESAVGWRDRCLKAERELDEWKAAQLYQLETADALRVQLAEAERERDWNAALVHELLPYQERAVAAETNFAVARAALEREVACRRWAYAQIRMWWKGVHRGGSAEAAVRELDREEKVLDEALDAMDNPDA